MLPAMRKAKPKEPKHMAATSDIRLPVTPDERAALARTAAAAGFKHVTAYVRTLLGLPPKERGRPRKPPTPKPKGHK
jgi:hypothetical protein